MRLVLSTVALLIVASGLVAGRASASSLSCTRTPAKCERIIRWQKHDRAHLKRKLSEKWTLASPTIKDAAFIAARVYGVDAWSMIRVSQCEISDAWRPGLRSSGAVNPSSGATGPAQFLHSTWQNTPFASWSPTNAYVAMLAMAQIVAHDGGWRQWQCQP